MYIWQERELDWRKCIKCGTELKRRFFGDILQPQYVLYCKTCNNIVWEYG